MADLEKTVAIIFEGVDQMGAGVTSATRSIDNFTGKVQTATQPLADLTVGVLKFEAAMLTAGVAVTGMAVKLAGDFDTAFREISTLIDAAPEDLAKFSDEILDYSRDSSQSLESITNSVYNAISAGADYTDSLAVVAQAERAAVAGKADLDGALGVLVSSLNAYGLGMDQAEHFSDLLFQTVRNGVTTLPELGNSLAGVTGLAATAGVSFEELLAAVATLTATGSGTSEAITQIRGAISNILNPTKQARDLAGDLSIEFNAAALESRGFAGLLQDVQQATGGNVEQMALLFGNVNALNGALTLTGLGAERFANNIVDMGNAAGATDEAYEKMADSVQLGTQRILNAMQGALIGVGQPLLDEFGGIQAAIAEIFNAIGLSVESGQLQGFVDRIESVFQGIEANLRTVAQNLPEALEQADFSGFFDGLDMMRDAVSTLFSGADLTTVDGLVSIIETLGLGFQTLSAYTAGAITSIGPFIEQVASLARWVLELNPELVAWVGAGGGLAVVIGNLVPIISGLAKMVGALAGTGGVVPVAVGAFGRLVTALTGPVGLTVAIVASLPLLEQLVTGLLGVETRAERLERIRLGPGDEETQRWRDYQAAIEDVSLEDFLRISEEFGYANDEMREAVGRTLNDLAEFDRRARERQGILIDWGSALDIVNIATEESVEHHRRLAKEVFDSAQALDDSAQQFRQTQDSVFTDRGHINNLAQQFFDYQQQFIQGQLHAEEWAAIQEEYYSRIADATDEAAQSQEELAGEVLTTEEAILKARQAVIDYELKLEELASNERIRSLELGIELQVAQLEADTRRVEAAFESINTAITSTGETLSDLYGILGSGDLSRLQELGLEREIQRESERRDEALRLQTELTEAQIEQMRARTEALQRGDGLIQISSDGLEPALEMIMWQILEKIQLRANAEGAEFLLGLNAGAGV